MVRNQIPNILTLLNLLMGCIALYFIFTQQFNIVLELMMIAAIADVFDGIIARRLGIEGGLGKQLDSLADVVSFGVVPGAILFQLIRYAYDTQNTLNMGTIGMIIAFGGFIFTLGAALRLARFNIDTRQTKEFIGLATPAATIAVLGLMLIHQKGTGPWFELIMNPYILLGFAIVLCALMNAPIRMFSLKSISSGWNANKIPILFSVLSIPAALIFKGPAVLLLPFVYVILSILIYRKA
jgi:CDP-diacylglycerol---serine O-phosphatidyltransferase